MAFYKLLRRLYRSYRKICRLEFSKKIAIFSVVLMFTTIIISSHLSADDKDPLSEISTAVITTCGGYLCTYGIKSAFEKNSRNKYRVDKDGVPFDYIVGEGDDEE